MKRGKKRKPRRAKRQPPLSQARFDLHIPDEYLLGIGLVAVYWAHLEVLCDYALVVFLAHYKAKLAIKEFGYKGHLAIAFKRRLRLWRMVAKAVLGRQKHLDATNALLDKLAGARAKRDAYIHGQWAVGLNDAIVRLISSDRESKPRETVTPASLRAFADELAELAVEPIKLLRLCRLPRPSRKRRTQLAAQ